jgi:hypothetical protein
MFMSTLVTVNVCTGITRSAVGVLGGCGLNMIMAAVTALPIAMMINGSNHCRLFCQILDFMWVP